MNFIHDYLQIILTLQYTHVLLQAPEAIADGIKVSQTPPEINISEGSSINMECSCEEDVQVESIRVDWNKDSESILNATSSNGSVNQAYINRLSYTVEKTKSTVTIKSITRDDAGLYQCQMLIEIPPPVRKGNGNGTILTVQAHKNTPELRAIVAASVLLLILVPIVLFYKKQQKIQRNRRNTTAVPVLFDAAREEISEENQENEGNEENSSSRGSSHWLASSLYESFDYFAIQNVNEEVRCSVSSR
ncbi:uncharacterized protein LOC125457469 [Stegostoma tigrinum]|uniref:uncharacterized protein LOC125457469 n=1 Tax=Stegostoma tigrinum TaxID=3053191 RepID=UPI00202B52CD|nr:uncharacterized protein LOC125457469 [Stegostoma tigrinum]